jgi:hypothetical protein
MSHPDDTPPSPQGQFLIYPSEDGKMKIEVRLENETVWLTQQQMSELFQIGVPTINYHLKEIFESGELTPEATIRNFRIVRQEGTRKVGRSLDFYNLDAIISVGYRVKSAVATRFRIWATQKLREFIVKGFVLDDERLKNPDRPIDPPSGAIRVNSCKFVVAQPFRPPARSRAALGAISDRPSKP